MTPQHSQTPPKTSVRASYTFKTLRDALASERNALDAKQRKTSYRKIGKKYGVSHAVIHRIVAYGIDPIDNHIRAALGLPPHTVEVAPCAKCGNVHVTKHCTANPHPRQPDPVIRVKKLRQRIAALRFSDVIRDEIMRELLP